MTDQESKVVTSEPPKLTPEQVVARRNFLKWGLIGGLVALPIGTKIIRTAWQPKVYAREMPCAIEKSGYYYYRGDEILKVIPDPKFGPYTITEINADDTGAAVIVYFSIDFADKLPPESQIEFAATFYSEDARILGQSSQKVNHPRYVAPEWRNVTGTRWNNIGYANVSSAWTEFRHSSFRTNDIASVRISIKELPRSKNS